MKALADKVDAIVKANADAITAMKSPVICAVRQTVVQSIPNAAYTAVSFDIEDIDPTDLHVSANPTRITIKVAGVYRLAGAGCLAQNATGFRRAAWHINGVTIPHSIQATLGSGQGTTLILSSPLMTLAANDYVELKVWQDSTAALSTSVGVGNQSFATVEYVSV